MHFDLQEAIDKIPNNTDFKSIIDYIIENFHIPARKILPELEEELDFLVKKYSEKYPEFIQIKELYKQFSSLFLKHINREEDVLFPQILEL
jgi:iron-sulfur cluster repair protein YtfE (RIC family)